jgi:hypothetical protein
VGDKNKMTIKDMIKIVPSMHMSQNVKKRKYGLVARYSIRNESNNLEDA